MSSSTSTAPPAPGILARELWVERLESTAHRRADVHHGEDHRVLVALEESAMKIGHAGTEHALEDASTNDRLGRALEQRLGGNQVRLALDQPVGDSHADLAGDGFVLERRRGAVRKLIGVEQRARRVPDYEGRDGENGCR